MEMKWSFIILLLSFIQGYNARSLGQKISKDVLEKLSRVKTLSDFRREFNIKEPNLKRTLNATAESNDGEAASTECNPQRQIVKLGEDQPGHFIYYPSCTFAGRCGGCCQPITLRHCVSTMNETLYTPAYRIAPDGTSFVRQ